MSADPTSDPDIAAALSLRQRGSDADTEAVATKDPDIAAAMKFRGDGEYAGRPAEPTWGQAFRGAADMFRGGAESVLHTATGTAGALGGGLTYLGTLAATGNTDAAKAVQEATEAAIPSYQPKTAEGKANVAAIGKVGTKLENAGEYVGSRISEGEQKLGIPSTIANMTGGTAHAVITGAPWLLGMRGSAATEAGPEAGTHPLAEAARTESQRLSDIESRGTAAGLDLPKGGTPARFAKASVNNTPVADDMVRNELNMPTLKQHGVEAPLTPQMYDQARTANVSPAYTAVRQVPKVDLGDNYDQTILKLKEESPSEYEAKFQPPSRNLTGDEAVSQSQSFRARANSLYKSYRRTLDPAAQDRAELYSDTAEAIENGVQEHLDKHGQGELGTNWDNARVYAAKSYNAEQATDPSGHINPANLKTQMFKQRAPLTGGLQDLATLAGRYPSAMKVSLEGAPRVSMGREIAAKITELAGTGGGAALGVSTGIPGAAEAGAIIGNASAGRLSDYIRGNH